MAKVIQINEMELKLEDDDLEQVDKEIEDQEKDERYKNFDDEMTFRKEGLDYDIIPAGWKVNPIKPEKSMEKVTEKQSSNRLETDDIQEETVNTDGENIRDGIPEEIESSTENYSRRMEIKQDKLRMKWAGTDYEIVTEKPEGMANWLE